MFIFGKFSMPCFHETPVLRFAFLLYYRRIKVLQKQKTKQKHIVYITIKLIRLTCGRLKQWNFVRLITRVTTNPLIEKFLFPPKKSKKQNFIKSVR